MLQKSHRLTAYATKEPQETNGFLCYKRAIGDQRFPMLQKIVQTLVYLARGNFYRNRLETLIGVNAVFYFLFQAKLESFVFCDNIDALYYDNYTNQFRSTRYRESASEKDNI